MKKHIAEELPSRSYAPVAAGAGSKKPEKPEERGEGSEEKQIRQAVYDIRYRARRENVPLRVAFSQYMQNSKLGSRARLIVKEKLFGKGGMQAEDFQIENFAYDNLAKAMIKVFVENSYDDEIDTEELSNELEEASNSNTERKYKVRVTDKNSGNTYVRYATRAKIAQLRANPNIESVEMTEYGEPYEGERTKGKQTAATLSNKDYDGDGKLESPAKEYRGAVHNAIQRKKGGIPDGKDTSSVKEDYISEVKKDKKIDILKGQNKVVVGPDDGSGTKADVMAHYNMRGTFVTEVAPSQAQQRFMAMVYKTKQGEPAPSPEVAKAASEMTTKQARDFAKTKHKGLPVHKEECGCDEKPKMGDGKESDDNNDVRSIPTKTSLVKNKLRSMGLKMSYEPEGDVIDEKTRYAKETGKNFRTGKKEPKGGRAANNLALQLVMKSIPRNARFRSRNQPVEQLPPAKRLEIRRLAAQQAEKLMRDTKGT